MSEIDYEAIRDAGLRQWPSIDVAAKTLASISTLSAAPERAVDTYLALASIAGDPGALQVFEQDAMVHVRPALLGSGVPRSQLDDVLQKLREELLVGSKGAPPKLLRYGGKGPLSAWLRVCAARAGVDHVRSSARGQDRSSALFEHLVAADHDLERLMAGAELRDRVRAAFVDALGDLPPRWSTTLRYRVLEGLSSREIAPLFRVHRGTVDRWLLAAKEQVLAAVQRRLMVELDLDASQAGSAIRAVASRLEFNLSSVFRAEPS